MKKALILIPAALLLFSCARTKRKGLKDDKKKKQEEVKEKDDKKVNDSPFSLGLKQCSQEQLDALTAIENTVIAYNQDPNDNNYNRIYNACVIYNNNYSFGVRGQCELLYKNQVVSSLQLSDKLWDDVCSHFNK